MGSREKDTMDLKRGMQEDGCLDFEDTEINLLDTERQRAFTTLNALSSSTSHCILDRSHRADVKTRMAQSAAQTVSVTSPRAGAVAVAIQGPWHTPQLKLSSPDLQLLGFLCRVIRDGETAPPSDRPQQTALPHRAPASMPDEPQETRCQRSTG